MTDAQEDRIVEAWPHVQVLLSVLSRVGFGGDVDPNRLSAAEESEFDALADMGRDAIVQIRRITADK